MVNIMSDRIGEDVDEKLQVPALIGPNRKYPTLSTYLSKLDKRLGNDLHEMNNTISDLQI